MHTRLKEISIYEAILARRSIREYTAEKVDVKRIRSLLEAAVMAPTDNGREPWSFLIIQDADRLQALSDVAKPLLIKQLSIGDPERNKLENPTFNLFHDAGTLIVIGVSKGGAVADCWLAAENMMLAACAMGLGSCVVSTAVPAINHQQEKLALGLDDDFEAVVPIVVGFPKREVEPSIRSRPRILNWIEGA